MLYALAGALVGFLACFGILAAIANARPRGLSAFWFPKLRRSHRHIFRYHDGTQTRWGDPLAILQRLNCDPEYDPKKHDEKAEKGDEDALEKLIAGTCRAFDVQLWDGNKGLARSEVMTLHRTFRVFMAHLKKKLAHWQRSQQSTGESTSSESSGVTIKLSSGLWKTTIPQHSENPTSSGKPLRPKSTSYWPANPSIPLGS